ncbi:aspartyl protease family protein [Mucilaginibacter defluvii]|uniref:Peptidase A2 domain-containing protein n=1 Tax=Mucilaginibacter defluvii TaxID=1196019 RepID=A0ABP9FSK8_9SPHI
MKYIYLLFIALYLNPVLAQQKLPVIKATSKKASIRDGGFLDKDAWNLSPQIRPDVYTAERTRETKWVTFYTDIDSIRVKVTPGSRFNFVVLLNGIDSCYTQIASAISPQTKQKVAAATDTIPFELTAFNAIKVKCILNNIDTLNMHFDVGSFDFRIIRDAMLNKTHLLTGQRGQTKPDFSKADKISKIQMGNTIWNNPEVAINNQTAHEMDGRFGWNLFEGKVVEVNYDKHLLLIHTQLPAYLKGYDKLKLKFIRSFVCVGGSFLINGKRYTGDFLMDTGADRAMILDSSWVARNNFPQNLKVAKQLEALDPRGVKYPVKAVVAPLYQLGKFRLNNVPALMLSGKNPVGFEINYLGNDLLKRFNLVFDFQHDQLYLKPNVLINSDYRS